MPVLFCFAYIARKESPDECQQSEFPAKLSSKRRRTSSQSSSAGNLTGTLGLHVVSIAPSSSAGRACAVGASLADLSEVIH